MGNFNDNAYRSLVAYLIGDTFYKDSCPLLYTNIKDMLYL